MRQTMIQIPSNIEDKDILRRTLLKIVDKIDEAFSSNGFVKGSDIKSTDNLDYIKIDLSNVELSNLSKLNDFIDSKKFIKSFSLDEIKATADLSEVINSLNEVIKGLK